MRLTKLSCLILALVPLAGGCKKQPSATPTALHQAAAAGNVEQCRLLIAHGANVNAGDEHGCTRLLKQATRQ